MYLELFSYTVPLPFVFALALLITFDYVTGYADAFLRKKVDSTVGIDGLIRKGSIIFAAIAFILFDAITGFDVMAILPSEVKEYTSMFGVTQFGLAEILIIGFCLNELTSVFENLDKLGIPLPKFVTKRLNKIKDSYFESEEE